jgi:hypothetical protein
MVAAVRAAWSNIKLISHPGANNATRAAAASGTGFFAAETGASIRLRRQEQRDRKLRAKSRHWRAKLASLHKAPDGQTGWWRTQSISNLSQQSEFPANREINREFRRIRPLDAILNANTRANSEACNKIPYATEQGIIFEKQGICWQEQGI